MTKEFLIDMAERWDRIIDVTAFFFVVSVIIVALLAICSMIIVALGIVGLVWAILFAAAFIFSLIRIIN